MRALVGLLVAVIVLPSFAFADALTYTNARFGTSVTFPARIFRQAMEPPPHGEGMTWLSDDDASIAVYAHNNALMVTPAELAEQAGEAEGRSDYEVTYRRHGDDWAVISGIEEGRVFYQRFEFGSDDIIHAVLLRYPPALRAKYDPLVGPIAESLSAP